MEITYRGANCVVINNKKTRLVVDDNLDQLGLKKVSKEGDVRLYTAALGETKPATDKAKFVVDSAGEYEIAGASIRGIAARAHVDPEDSPKQAVIYKIIVDDTKIVVLGNIYPELSDQQLENIGTVDILITPVGGSGYTLDAVGAISLAKKIEPKVIVPI